jgi:methylated-DNA-[protein]-cysteine S-methyltransferase
MQETYTSFYKTPIGTAKIVGNKNGIQSVSVLDQDIKTSKVIPSCFQECILQLKQYFYGQRTEFNLKNESHIKKVIFTLRTYPFI